MQSVKYYREKAAVARRLGKTSPRPEVVDLLRCIARDYDDLATDLEDGAIDITNPELLPQHKHH